MAVFDASALMRAAVQSSASGAAVAAIEAHDAVAPDIIAVEVANALWRYVRAGEMNTASAIELLAAALATIEIVPASNILLTEALRIACDQRHPVYDCVYVALAQRLSTSVVTADLKLAGLARRLHVPVILLP